MTGAGRKQPVHFREGRYVRADVPAPTGFGGRPGDLRYCERLLDTVITFR